MREISLDKWYKKLWYYFSWLVTLSSILLLFIIVGLYSYGSKTVENTEKVKGVLNKSYQTFIYSYSVISMVGLIVIGFLFILLG